MANCKAAKLQFASGMLVLNICSFIGELVSARKNLGYKFLKIWILDRYGGYGMSDSGVSGKELESAFDFTFFYKFWLA